MPNRNNRYYDFRQAVDDAADIDVQSTLVNTTYTPGVVTNEEMYNVWSNMLQELKKMNVYLSLMNNVHITDEVE